MREVDYPLDYDEQASDVIRVRQILPVKTMYPPKLSLLMVRVSIDRLSYIEGIRRTWCDVELQRVYHMKCLFYFVEETVEEERKRESLLRMNETYGDISFIHLPGFKEGWDTIYHKNIKMFEDGVTRYPDYKFYAVIDDEDYINIEVLANYLTPLIPQNVVFGKVLRHPPHKDPSDRYFDKLAFHSLYYPFVSGVIELYSSDIAHFIGNEYNYHHQPPSSLDDTALGFLIYKYYRLTGQKVHIHHPDCFDNFIIHRKKPRFMQDYARDLFKGYFRDIGNMK
ncbi:beta-1,3-N-acetylglucosaminyltransferase, putative [Entamoeba invadens IP1]|uniref:beta-1,3-N-acetylglucosaminyltransferase, putative n=1 Tax=Entamoeba invadens IP1 TaxID=370355 RepID=UPI0002C3F418|nr:beta-1,3-N-acetylglucosaminyltransferase, putative [Entamoeba invadens IP1]ELP94265.1 beta-1,3-N-acetylglucosaminyltransferase, putative [Entamoeba invadens IP1]|eukprot:XP_004261036.1 beta-1,3-N-acetylglucosaminyltransferase, putative [Entamoeba invadens IP1]